jgi:trk system potassium uptake protein TrkA
MVGKTLIELALPKKYGIMVVAVRRGNPSAIFQPEPNEPLKENDSLVLVSKEEAIKRLLEGN